LPGQPPGRFYVFYDEFASSGKSPALVEGSTAAIKAGPSIDHDVVRVSDRQSLRALTAALAGDPVLAGSLSIVDCTISDGRGTKSPARARDARCRPSSRIPPDDAPAFFSATMFVYDLAALERWHETEATPTFANTIPLDAIPSVDEAAFDLQFSTMGPDGLIAGAMRVRSADGALAILWSTEDVPLVQPQPRAFNSLSPNEDSVAVASCSAGPFWPLCCQTELGSCRTANPTCCASRCGNCHTTCYDCAGNNPCHACGDCGFAPFGCFLPGGRCASQAFFQALKALLFRSFCIKL